MLILNHNIGNRIEINPLYSAPIYLEIIEENTDNIIVSIGSINTISLDSRPVNYKRIILRGGQSFIAKTEGNKEKFKICLLSLHPINIGYEADKSIRIRKLAKQKSKH